MFAHPGHGHDFFGGACCNDVPPLIFGSGSAVAGVDTCWLVGMLDGGILDASDFGGNATFDDATDFAGVVSARLAGGGVIVALGGGDVAIVERGGGSTRCNKRRALNASFTAFDWNCVSQPVVLVPSKSTPGMCGSNSLSARRSKRWTTA